ncbi:hypothetical protein [Pasteurella multocida]
MELKAENNPTLDKVDIDIGETAWNASEALCKLCRLTYMV